MLKRIRKILLFGDFSHAQMQAIKPQIMEENRKFSIIWSIVNVVFWIYCLIMTTRDPLYYQCREIYAGALALSTAALALSILVAPKRPGVVLAVPLILDEVLLVAGILIASRLAPKTIVVFAAVLIVPVWFITDSLSNLLVLLVNIVVMTQIGSRSLDSETYRWVLSNLCIFSVLGFMLGHFVNRARFERYIFAEANAELAQVQARNARYDQLTNLQNRRAFDETVDQLSKKMPAGCQVVMIDINGLKEANDRLGHNAGDELIIGAAECIKQSFEGTDNIYRIGGDEFCVIITDPAYDVEAALNRLQELSAGWKGEYINGVSISAGTAEAEESSSIDTVVKAADQKMYENKRRYYENSGRDRRRRRAD